MMRTEEGFECAAACDGCDVRVMGYASDYGDACVDCASGVNGGGGDRGGGGDVGKRSAKHDDSVKAAVDAPESHACPWALYPRCATWVVQPYGMAECEPGPRSEKRAAGFQLLLSGVIGAVTEISYTHHPR